VTIRRSVLVGALKVVGALTLYYAALVCLLLTVGMGEDIFGPAQSLPGRVLGGLCVALIGGLPLAITGARRTTISTLFITFQLAFVHVPSCALCAVHEGLPLSFALMTAGLLASIGLLPRPVGKVLQLRFSLALRLALAAPLVGLFAYAAWVFAGAVLGSHFSFASVFDLDALYEYRAEIFAKYRARELTALSVVGYFIVPALMIAAAHARRWTVVALLLAPVLLLYGVTGMKAYLAVPGFAVVTYLMARTFRVANFLSGFLALLLAVLVGAGAVGVYLASPWPLALTFSRGVMAPGQLHLVYGQYFAHSARISIWELPSSTLPGRGGLTSAELVHRNVFGGNVGQGEGANTGMIGTAFAVYGYVGVLAHSAVMLVLLAFLDDRLRRRPSSILPFAAIPSLFLVTNIDLLSAFFYFGLGLTVVSTAALSRRGSRLPQPAEAR